MNTIKEQWEFFENLCLVHASYQEREQARVAFHAGVMSLLKLQMELTEDKNFGEKEAAAHFQGWLNEMDEFAIDRIQKIKSRFPPTRTH